MSKTEAAQLKTEAVAIEAEAVETKKPNKETVELDYPIARGKEEIASIVLSKPYAQHMVGINLMDLSQMDVQSLIKILPRITDPKLTEMDVRRLDPADLLQCGVTISSFLLKKSAETEAFHDM